MIEFFLKNLEITQSDELKDPSAATRVLDSNPVPVEWIWEHASDNGCFALNVKAAGDALPPSVVEAILIRWHFEYTLYVCPFKWSCSNMRRKDHPKNLVYWIKVSSSVMHLNRFLLFGIILRYMFICKLMIKYFFLKWSHTTFINSSLCFFP